MTWVRRLAAGIHQVGGFSDITTIVYFDFLPTTLFHILMMVHRCVDPRKLPAVELHMWEKHHSRQVSGFSAFLIL